MLAMLLNFFEKKLNLWRRVGFLDCFYLLATCQTLVSQLGGQGQEVGVLLCGSRFHLGPRFPREQLVYPEKPLQVWLIYIKSYLLLYEYQKDLIPPVDSFKYLIKLAVWIFYQFLFRIVFPLQLSSVYCLVFILLKWKQSLLLVS